MINKQCHVKSAIGIEGLYVGQVGSFQVKLYQGEVSFHSTRKEVSLIPRPVKGAASVSGVKVVVGNLKKLEERLKTDHPDAEPPATDQAGPSSGQVGSTSTDTPASSEEDGDALLDE
jgi:hypothetical protein